MESMKLKIPDEGFAGQGFNFFIVDHIERIVNSKEPIEVQFIIPLQQKMYPFRISSIGPVKNGIASFRAEIDNWLFRLVAPRIDVKYDVNKKVLIEYKGPSNLLNKNKDIKPVVIKYDSSGISVKKEKQQSQQKEITNDEQAD